MNRSLKFGLASIVAAVLLSLVAMPDDAEARHHRRGRGGCFGCGGYNGCCGQVSYGCCGVAAAPACGSPCGAGGCVTSAPAAAGCTNCTVGGTIQGGYSAAYPATNGHIQHGSPSLAPAAPAIDGQVTPPAAPNGAATGTFREESREIQREQTREGASPSDRNEQRSGTNEVRRETTQRTNGQATNSQGTTTNRSAPPPPPER